MKLQTLEYITDLYENYAELHLIRFDNRNLSVLSSSVSKLISSLGEQKNLTFWPILISALKRFRFELATTPLPFTSPVLLSDELRASLNEALESSVQFPEYIDHLKLINDLINDLPDEEHPFMKWLKSEYSDGEKEGASAICLPNTKNLYAVEQFIEQNNLLPDVNYEIVNPRQLKKYIFYDRITFCGSVHLFSENQYTDYEYVWRSPRAKKLCFLSFSWIKEEFNPGPAFDVSPNRLPLNIYTETIPEKPDVEKKVENQPQPATAFEDLNFSPLSFLDSGLNKSSRDYHSGIADCECSAVLLDDGSFLYKDIDSYSHIVRFDPETEVDKIPNKDLKQGMPLIVRTEGSDDSISAVADMLFGNRAASVRKMQDDWKICFRRKVFSFEYLADVQKELIRLGSKIANEINIRNWIRNETIKPKDFEEFKAIMKFSGIPEKTEVYWNNAKQIFTMHIRAGKEISNLLRSQITKTDMNDFARYGKIEVNLPSISGKLSVIHIEAVSPEKYTVRAGLADKLQYN